MIAGMDDNFLMPMAFVRRVKPDNPTMLRVETIPSGRSADHDNIPKSTAGVIDRRQSAYVIRRTDPDSALMSRRERHQPCTTTTQRGITAALGTSTPLPDNSGGSEIIISDVNAIRMQHTTVVTRRDANDRLRAQALQPSAMCPLNISAVEIDNSRQSWLDPGWAVDPWTSAIRASQGKTPDPSSRFPNVSSAR